MESIKKSNLIEKVERRNVCAIVSSLRSAPKTLENVKKALEAYIVSNLFEERIKAKTLPIKGDAKRMWMDSTFFCKTYLSNTDEDLVNLALLEANTLINKEAEKIEGLNFNQQEKRKSELAEYSSGLCSVLTIRNGKKVSSVTSKTPSYRRRIRIHQPSFATA